MPATATTAVQQRGHVLTLNTARFYILLKDIHTHRNIQLRSCQSLRNQAVPSRLWFWNTTNRGTESEREGDVSQSREYVSISVCGRARTTHDSEEEFQVEVTTMEERPRSCFYVDRCLSS